MFMESFWVLFGIDNYKDMEIFVKEVKEWVKLKINGCIRFIFDVIY